VVPKNGNLQYGSPILAVSEPEPENNEASS